jgi:hypothetical protein
MPPLCPPHRCLAVCTPQTARGQTHSPNTAASGGFLLDTNEERKRINQEDTHVRGCTETGGRSYIHTHCPWQAHAHTSMYEYPILLSLSHMYTNTHTRTTYIHHTHTHTHTHTHITHTHTHTHITHTHTHTHTHTSLSHTQHTTQVYTIVLPDIQMSSRYTNPYTYCLPNLYHHHEHRSTAVAHLPSSVSMNGTAASAPDTISMISVSTLMATL